MIRIDKFDNLYKDHKPKRFAGETIVLKHADKLAAAVILSSGHYQSMFIKHLSMKIHTKN